MGIEENNKELVHQFYELYNQHNLEAAWELMSPEWHSGDFTFEQNKQFDIMLINAFPDVKSTILDMVAEGDKVACMVNGKGTHTGGPYMGLVERFMVTTYQIYYFVFGLFIFIRNPIENSIKTTSTVDTSENM